MNEVKKGIRKMIATVDKRRQKVLAEENYIHLETVLKEYIESDDHNFLKFLKDNYMTIDEYALMIFMMEKKNPELYKKYEDMIYKYYSKEEAKEQFHVLKELLGKFDDNFELIYYTAKTNIVDMKYISENSKAFIHQLNSVIEKNDENDEIIKRIKSVLETYNNLDHSIQFKYEIMNSTAENKDRLKEILFYINYKNDRDPARFVSDIRANIHYNDDPDKVESFGKEYKEFYKSQELGKEVFKNIAFIVDKKRKIVNAKDNYVLLEPVLKEYIESDDHNFLKLLKDNNMTIDDFALMIFMMKNKNPELYKKYEDMIYGYYSKKEAKEQFDVLKELLGKFDDNFELIYHVAKEDIVDMEKIFDNSKSFLYQLNSVIEKNDENEEITRRIKIVLEDYRKLAHSIIYKFEVMNSTAENKDRLKEILFYMNYKNGKNPARVISDFLNVEIYNFDPDKAKAFTEEYRKFYKRMINEKKTKVQELKEEERATYEKLHIPEYESIITDFLTSDIINISDYCELKEISQLKIKEMANVLKKYNSPVYDEYITYIETKRDDNFKRLIYIVDKLIKIMEESEGNFNILDYYDLVSVPLDDIKKIVYKSYKLTPRQKREFAKFYHKNFNQKELTPKEIDDYIYRTEVTTGGLQVLDDIHTVTEEEKKKALSDLRKKNAPITHQTLRIMLKRNYDQQKLSDE